ncbi:hypothetical protein PAJ_0601 [Pantoea ananatis AJ13355]|uniref:Uncharacterized protein n=1 Tax=Pantoea ananatis (strain AJ13355) TaxID=932677 RepID=A0A0H3KUI0_PANAA|nr:hypothetical protein PAJ_0601 [Pantoea ananatis AJ13355]
MADQRIRIAVFSNATFINKDQPRCDFLCKADFMGDDDHRHAFFSQILHHLQDFMTKLRVQRRGRLIEKHHLGLNRQRAGNCDTLLLAAGQLRGKVTGAFGQAHFSQQALRQLTSLFFAGTPYPNRTKSHVIQGAHLREKVKLLEHHARFLTNQAIVDFGIVNFQSIDNQLTAGDLFQLVNTAQQCGFTGAGWANNYHHFSLLNFQVDIV